jgi:Zn-dependent M28 family amino/carboxypeptidase
MDKNVLVLVDTSFAARFKGMQRFTGNAKFQSNVSQVFILTSNTNPSSISLHIQNQLSEQHLKNIVGVIPGKSKKNEYVVFSGHYDHLGIGKPDKNMDSIYNGANDDAAGTTAVMMLAKYFSAKKNNQRTLIFVAFTAEEIGGFGSRYFSKQMDPDKVVALFNIEMIGTESKWGTNSAYITGYEKSDMGKILQANLTGSKFHFEPDPYPKQNLFYRSDNATLAELGVPAHTISTSKMEEAPNNEPNYHKQSDEIGTLDMNNMAEIIKAVALSSVTIISGKDTPSRVEKMK